LGARVKGGAALAGRSAGRVKKGRPDGRPFPSLSASSAVEVGAYAGSLPVITVNPRPASRTKTS